MTHTEGMTTFASSISGFNFCTTYKNCGVTQNHVTNASISWNEKRNFLANFALNFIYAFSRLLSPLIFSADVKEAKLYLNF